MSKSSSKRLIDSDGELSDSAASALPLQTRQGDLKYCIHCGSANRAEGRYCRTCGQSLEDQEVAPEDQFPLRGGKAGQKTKGEKGDQSSAKGEKGHRPPLEPHEAAVEVIIALVVLATVLLVVSSPAPWVAIGVLFAWLMVTAARYGALN